MTKTEITDLFASALVESADFEGCDSSDCAVESATLKAELFQAVLHSMGLHVARISGRKPASASAGRAGFGARVVTYAVGKGGAIEPVVTDEVAEA